MTETDRQIDIRTEERRTDTETERQKPSFSNPSLAFSLAFPPDTDLYIVKRTD